MESCLDLLPFFAFFSHHTHIRVGGQPEGGTVKAVTNSF